MIDPARDVVAESRTEVMSDDEVLRRAALIECGHNGHSFSVLTTFGSLDPVKVVCDRCGASWGIIVEPS